MYNKNDVAPTPPMGWNSYDYYNTTVTEDDVRQNALYMSKNLKKMGFEYIVIDIQWSDPDAGTQNPIQYIPFSHFCIDEFSRQIPAVNRFPSSKDGQGFKPLADYIHSLGLKFGIHIMRGIPRFAAHTHMKIKGTRHTANEIANPYSLSRWNPDMYGVDYTKPGSQEYYNSVFELYSQWGVDFVKVDDICNTNMYPQNPYSAEKEIEMIAKAIEKCGRQIVLSLSPGPAVIEKAWHLEKYANMWRITDDLWDDWPLVKAMFERCETWQRHVGSGNWPDCDMLPLGKLGKGFGNEWECRLSESEQRTLMTLWCIFRSPLMIGTDLRLLEEPAKSFYTNIEAMNLIKHSKDAFQVMRNNEKIVWTSFDDNNEYIYVALFNISDKNSYTAISIEELESSILVQTGKHISLSGKILRDIWRQKYVGDIGVIGAPEISAQLQAHDAVLYRLEN